MTNVTALIYGKDGCPFCEKAKMLTAEIQKKNKVNLTLEYHNYIEENLTKEQVTKLVKAPSEIQTVPQVKLTVDGKEEYIGGFTEYYAYVTGKTDWLKA